MEHVLEISDAATLARCRRLVAVEARAMVYLRAAELVTADTTKGERAAAPPRHQSLFVAQGTIRTRPRMLSLWLAFFVPPNLVPDQLPINVSPRNLLIVASADYTRSTRSRWGRLLRGSGGPRCGRRPLRSGGGQTPNK